MPVFPSMLNKHFDTNCQYPALLVMKNPYIMKTLWAKTNTFMKPLVEKITSYIQAGIYIIVAGFAIIICFALPFSKLADPKFDALPITNYCFAIMGGCASICFSWSRNVDQTNKKLINQISFCGERSFLAALSFVVASALKFFVINKTEYLNKANAYIILVFEISAMISFMISLLIGLSAIYYILKLLSRHITENQKFEDL